MKEFERRDKKAILEMVDQIHLDLHSDFEQALDELVSIPAEFESDRDRIKAEIKVLRKYARRIFDLYTEVNRMKESDES